jgi:uncharacterized protein (TIGR00251 family)
MKISVKVTPNAKKERIEKLSDSEFRLWVKARPVEGEANAAVVDLLSRYFGIPRSCVNIILGRRSRNKIITLTIPPR